MAHRKDAKTQRTEGMKYDSKYIRRDPRSIYEFIKYLCGFKGVTLKFLQGLSADKLAMVDDYYSDQWAAIDNVLTRPRPRPAFLPKSAEGGTPKWQRRKERR